MSKIELNNSDNYPQEQSSSESRHSINSSDDHTSSVILHDDNETPQEIKSLPKIKKLSTSRTLRQTAVIPSIGRHVIQGVLVRFFRNGDTYHPGVKIAINELEIKSWEAFLNYLNRQSRLVLSSGGIKHVYTINGQEIHSLNKLQNRQSYVVASGTFMRTSYRHINDTFNDNTEINITQSTNDNLRSTGGKQWRSPPINGEQIFLLPYSRLNMYESIILNRNIAINYNQWLNKEVTDILSRYIGNDIITHLYAIKKFEFTEVKSFSHLFYILNVTDSFIACTDEEFTHSKRYLAPMRPDNFFANSLQRYNPKQTNIGAKLSINWIHGYDGTKEQTKTLYALSEHEILYIIGTVCIIYEPNSKQQRFYTKHRNPITCICIHRCHSIVASNEINSLKDRTRVSIHIWDYVKLETIAELRKEQFGSDIFLLSFSPKSHDNFLLIVSRDKPKTLLFVDWKRQEIIYSITTKSDKILSALFVFDTIEWIVCVSQQHLLFYNINWNSKPLRIDNQRESQVQNIYTGAIVCDHFGGRVIVGDKVGSVHIWSLINNEPKLIEIKENILENDVQIIVSLTQDLFILANGQNQIKLWNIQLNTNEQIRLNDTFGSIQSICCIRNRLIIGTKMNYILSKEIDTEQIEIIMRGHIIPPICICCNKNNDYFYSISPDRYLFKWNNKTRSIEWSIKSPQLISCAALHPERNIIILGTETNKLLIYDTLSSFYIRTIILKVNTGIKCVRFSPDGKDLAIGLQNGTIWIFDVLGNGEFQLRTDGTSQYHNAPVTDVIWSIDSSYLLGVYSDNNYNIWSIPSFDIVKGKNIQNISWHQAIHPTACNILDKSIIDAQILALILSSNLVLCCGKDGQIRLFRNSYEYNSQILQFGLGSIRNLVPSTNNNTFLLSMNNNPTIVEICINIES